MRVGLTGGVASGKSTVSTMMADLGAVVIDSDLLARQVVARGTPGLQEVVEAFGPEILTEDGELDRPKVGAIVFDDEARRRVLEGIIHPRVRAASAEIEVGAGAGDLVVHDIPLLVEAGMDGLFEAVVVVDVPQELQVERMVRDRGWTREHALSRIASQATREDRRSVATHVIENTGDADDLRRRVAEVVGMLRAD